ncbi:Oxoglutarate and iron-dependent oxygenase degradation C-term-domain-containing protein [Tirmania nivea]|nr:Oxoglutarate and iron-dependent oxygenase degradation C-term-domain-containing protein [Tirmania nivea]
MTKRKSAYAVPDRASIKKRPGSRLNPANAAKPEEEADRIKASFTKRLFEKPVKDGYRDFYTASEPYKHAVIQPLIDDSLLRNVRKEILNNLHFTRKETDIYRIHQSGDLANLSGLSPTALKLLPSVLQLRNAMYSKQFRDYISEATNCGPLSGKKTDMAINVYTRGCHLLCHDDVIGSRRVSYILYLTDPDDQWKPQWGGSLRLYPTILMDDGRSRVPSAEWSKVISPAWNQLTFFAVQPGESFHDVEEVFEDGKVRMAISGWFHIPQEGEEGYIEGEEEKLAEKSSLQQLQSKSDKYDLPQPNTKYYDTADAENETIMVEDNDGDDESFSEADCEFLLKYISPAYLTPDTLEAISDELSANFSIQLTNFLSKKYAAKVKAYIEARDGSKGDTKEKQEAEGWKVAVPPHKQRFLYLQDMPLEVKETGKGKGKQEAPEENPIQEIISQLFPSKPFRKLLHLATGMKLSCHDLLARRFRRGLDYTLATGWEADPSNPQEGDVKIEVCLGLTPSKRWDSEVEDGDDDDEEEEEEEEEEGGKKRGNLASKGNGKGKVPVPPKETGPFSNDGAGVGGYEMYMAGDGDDGESEDEEGEKDQKFGGKMGKKSDPAIYKSAANDEDDGAVFTMGAIWNRLSIVLRDGGLLKFVKYVSQAAEGDRWDIVGGWGTVNEGDDGDDDEEEGDEGEKENGDEERDDTGDGDDGEEWNGIQN